MTVVNFEWNLVLMVIEFSYIERERERKGKEMVDFFLVFCLLV